MNVIHLSHRDGGGGAAVAACRLHAGLLALGVDSTMVVGQKLGSELGVIGWFTARRAKLLQRLDRLPRRLLRTTNEGLITPSWIGSHAWKFVNRRAPDIAHLHWIGEGFLNIEAISRLTAPVVWSLHDMWAMAGGEHYVEQCHRYRTGYLRGNRPAGEHGFDLNRWAWRRKQRAWPGIQNLSIFAVSRWMADRARESVLFRDRPIEVLYNGLDPTVFKPQNREAARQALGLPPRLPLVLYGALAATSDRRKGFDLLQDALGHLRRGQSVLEVVVFGNSAPSATETNASPTFKTHYLGRIDDPTRLALVYAACNVMVVPSREEAFGQTALEALACGTPVAAFRVGGLPEVVEHDVTGFLARPFDTAELGRGISWLLARDGAFAAACRSRVEEKFTLEIQARRCRQLYGRALERSR